MMAAEPANELSVDEATQYDRQIRLWGVDAQKRYFSVHCMVKISDNIFSGIDCIYPLFMLFANAFKEYPDYPKQRTKYMCGRI